MSSDEEYMQRALALARRGRDAVSPNPMVGAVVVRAGQVVGEGYHRRCGGPHAEVHALERAGRRARGADLFVTLEPCAHRGRTPPCTEAILDAGLARVVYAVVDPNPRTRGRGPRQLRAGGVVTETGVCRAAARELNAPYFHWRRTAEPWVILKWAMTLDGKIAAPGGESQWITGEAARRYAHRLRRRVDGVLVGTETARRDDPRLCPRPARGRFPYRIVLDRRGRLPLGLKLLTHPFVATPPRGAEVGGLLPGVGQTIYVASSGVSARRLSSLRARGVYVLVASSATGGFRVRSVFKKLGALGVSQVLVEGGGALAGACLEAGRVDEVVAFVAPRLLGGDRAPGPLGGTGVGTLAATAWLQDARWRRLGDDYVVEGRLKRRA